MLRFAFGTFSPCACLTAADARPPAWAMAPPLRDWAAAVRRRRLYRCGCAALNDSAAGSTDTSMASRSGGGKPEEEDEEVDEEEDAEEEAATTAKKPAAAGAKGKA